MLFDYIFEKILLNSTKMLKDLTLFPKKDLKELLDNLKISNFNEEYILRRKNLAEVYFFDKELQIETNRYILLHVIDYTFITDPKRYKELMKVYHQRYGEKKDFNRLTSRIMFIEEIGKFLEGLKKGE